MIVAHQLTKRFGPHVAVDAIDFRIRRGRVVGFLGPNGAGKTTTIRMIAGFLPPSSGTVTVDGLDVSVHPRAVRRKIGYLPESTPLYPEMRVQAYLAFRGSLFGLGRAERRAAMGRVIDRCGLEDVRRRPIRHLSKGYRQRVGLAAALLHDPPVIILDEPTVGLDPAQIRAVRSLIRDLAGDRTILFSTHILPEVEMVCDDVVMVARGRVQLQGPIDDVRSLAARGRRYVLETDAPDAAATLRALPRIVEVETKPLDDGWCRMTIAASAGGEDLRESIGRSLHGAGATVRELRGETPTLEHLFVQLVSGEPIAAAAKGAAS
ncbi:MAG: ABC transporter ATP-binding protein [Phycisphaerales bacterium]|nr:ABC transporter ATP-binding protein [Phycisphaerae bacterium]NNF44341.1 ABC transporter ATP-binding protein [Phycisphaerales bacterium]NNM25620.1 ABC transporter ATP-binding protein [Phycisphaerales bacterium]